MVLFWKFLFSRKRKKINVKMKWTESKSFYFPSFNCFIENYFSIVVFPHNNRKIQKEMSAVRIPLWRNFYEKMKVLFCKQLCKNQNQNLRKFTEYYESYFKGICFVWISIKKVESGKKFWCLKFYVYIFRGYSNMS